MLISKYDTTNIDKKIIDFEKELNIKLPEQYRKFMIKYNGGDMPETDFKIKNEGSDVSYFYGIGDVDNSFSDIPFIEDFTGRDILPIASDSFGNIIAIGVKGNSEGKIYFCDHEKGYKKYHLCDSLVEFIKKCKSEKIEPVPSIEERKKIMIENGNGDNISELLIKMWQDEINRFNIVYEEVLI